MIKHRLTALFITIVMVISCFGFTAVSADDTDALADVYNVVTDLGITDKTYGSITRGEFCIMLVNTVNYNFARDSMLDRVNYPFEDVTPSISSYDAIRYLKDIGIVNGYYENIFLPEKEIVLEEAVVMIMRLLKMEGVTDDSKLYSLAAKYKLLKDIDISSREALDAPNAIKLIYNLMHTDISNSYEYYYDDSKYFYQIMGLEQFEGMVTDDGTCSINGESGLAEGRIVIGNEEFYNLTGKEDLFAYEVEGYYTIDSTTRRKAIVSLITLEDSNEIFTADDIISYGDYVYEIHTGDNKTDTYKLSKDFTLIYNGRLVAFDSALTADRFKQMMTPASGSIMLVDMNKGGGYDIVKIKSYHNMVTGTVTRSDDGSVTVINKYDTTDRFVIDSKMDSVVLSSAGSVRTLDAIIKDTAIAIAASYDGEAVEIILGSNAKKGSIKEMTDDTYIIDNAEYYISAEFEDYLTEHPEHTPQIGKNGTYYLTFENEILYYDSAKGDDFVYALFGNTDARGFDYEISFYTEDNNFVILSLKDKVKIDGKSYKKSDAQEYFDRKAADMNCTMVMIKYDEEMNLTEIDTPYLESDGFISNGYETAASLHYIKNLKEKDQKYTRWLTSFQNQVCITEATKAFFLPEGEDDIRETKVISQTNKKFKQNSGTVTISALSTLEDALVAEAVLIRDYYYPNVRESEEDENLNVVLVKEVRKRLTSDGSEASALYITDGYYENTYIYESEQPWGYYYEDGETKKKLLSAGDVIRIGVDDEKRIAEENVTLIYDCSEGLQHYQGINFTNPTSWTWNNFSTPGGYIIRKTEGYIEFSQKDPAEGIDYNKDTTYVFSTTKANVVITENIDGRCVVSYGTLADIVTYKESPYDYDKKIVINNRSGELLAVFVYR